MAPMAISRKRGSESDARSSGIRVTPAPAMALARARREESLRAEVEDGGHQDVDAHRGERRARRLREFLGQEHAQDVLHEDAADHFDEADQDRGDECAPDRADASDHDDDESEDELALAHAG